MVGGMEGNKRTDERVTSVAGTSTFELDKECPGHTTSSQLGIHKHLRGKRKKRYKIVNCGTKVLYKSRL